LDVKAAAAFLDGDGLAAHVWSWYGRTVREFGIRAIPLFAFSVPRIGVSGGPFQPLGAGGDAYVVRGSMSADYFTELFEVVWRDARAGRRVHDARSRPFQNVYNDHPRRAAATEDGTCSN
jgi:predicted DsbA family dithiol-disulfide isomerase